MYDLEQQEDAFNYLKQYLNYTYFINPLKYVLIGLTENSYKKVSKNEVDKARKF